MDYSSQSLRPSVLVCVTIPRISSFRQVGSYEYMVCVL